MQVPQPVVSGQSLKGLRHLSPAPRGFPARGRCQGARGRHRAWCRCEVRPGRWRRLVRCTGDSQANWDIPPAMGWHTALACAASLRHIDFPRRRGRVA